MTQQTSSASVVRKRLPRLLSVALAVIGAVWFIAALAAARQNHFAAGTGEFKVAAWWFATNASGAVLMLMTAGLGFLDRPVHAVRGWLVAVMGAVYAIPVASAVFTAFLAQRYDVANSSATDILLVTVAALSAVLVFRSSPREHVRA